MLRLLLAPDKFKGSLSAAQACQALQEGFLASGGSSFHLQSLPMADGGEGTAHLLTQYVGGTWQSTKVLDPLFRPIEAHYGLSPDKKTAFIEMAEASGLARLAPNERKPLHTTSYGTGQLIEAAYRAGARTFVLGLGGSATTEAGMGMAAALGYQFWDAEGVALSPVGANMERVARIVPPENLSLLQNSQFLVACDVQNPLYGSAGAAHCFAAQKGASVAEVARLEHGLQHFALRLAQFTGQALHTMPGAGAAGGMGAGAGAFLSAALRPGIEVVMEYSRFEDYLPHTDLIITGEGKLDTQTLLGKTIAGIAQKARPWSVPVVAVCGHLALSPAHIQALGLVYADSFLVSPRSLAQAQEAAYALLRDWAGRMSTWLSFVFSAARKRS